MHAISVIFLVDPAILQQLSILTSKLDLALGADDSVHTRASRGREIRDYLNPIAIPIPRGDAVASADAMILAAQMSKEAAANGVITPLLRHLMKDDQLQIFDSQSRTWLVRGVGASFKPDYFVLHPAFFTRVDALAGTPFSSNVFECLRCIIDGKLDDCTDNDSLGQARDYAKVLLGLVHVLLFDKSARFRAVKFKDGVAFEIVDGLLTELGSKEFVTVFLRGPQPPCAREVDVRLAITACAGTYRIDDGHAILGCGGTSIVYRFQKIDVPRGMVAIKVVPAKFRQFADQEIENSKSFQADQSRKHICSVLLNSYRLSNESSALVFNGYQPVQTPTLPLVRLAAQCIGRLHATGYLHGDCRWPNFVLDGSRMLLADLAMLQPNAAVTGRKSDMARFIASLAKRGGAQDMNRPPDFILREVWSEAATVYNQYVEKYAESPSETAALIFINYFEKVFANVQFSTVKTT